MLSSVQNLEIIDPLRTELWGSSNKKRSLFQMLKTTKTIGGYVSLKFINFILNKRQIWRCSTNETPEIQIMRFHLSLGFNFLHRSFGNAFIFYTEELA